MGKNDTSGARESIERARINVKEVRAAVHRAADEQRERAFSNRVTALRESGWDERADELEQGMH